MSSKTKTIATKEEAMPALVPKLRFPEFREADGWKPKRLGLTLKFQAGFPFPSAGFNDSGKGLRLIRNRDLRSDDIVKFYSDDFDSNFVVKNGDVLVGMDGDFTPTVWEKGEALLNQRVGRILPREDNDRRFLLYLLTLCLKGIEEATARTTVKHLSHSAVEDKYEPLPSPAEQQKIAECLSSVDELIAAQARKLDALKTHKKGLMQQLFPREGETQPRLRFPEFQNAGDWVEDKLIDIATFRRGSFPQPYGLPEWYDEVGGMPFVQVFDVGDNFRLKDKTKSKISKLGAEKSVFIPKGTLIVTLQGSIGRVAITHYDAYIDRTLLIFETFLKPIEKVFFARLIQNLFDIEKEIAPGGIIRTITKEALSDFKVKLPTIDEQQRIADCLTSLDDLIAAQTQTLEALKTHKQGLMQQLFPSTEE